MHNSKTTQVTHKSIIIVTLIPSFASYDNMKAVFVIKISKIWAYQGQKCFRLLTSESELLYSRSTVRLDLISFLSTWNWIRKLRIVLLKQLLNVPSAVTRWSHYVGAKQFFFRSCRGPTNLTLFFLRVTRLQWRIMK